MSKYVLDKSEMGNQPPPTTRFAGAITGLYGDVLQGWAVDTVEPDQRLVIEICIDGGCVTLIRADQFEPNAKTGDQFNGFAVQLRQGWLDEARHITARIANQDFALEGELRLPSPGSKPALIASQVWHTGGLRIGGWAWDPQAPLRHVQVTVREGNRVLTQVTCDVHHQALAYRDSSKHGFAVDLPWELADGKLHTLAIEDDLGQPLAGSPITLCCRPEGIEGLLKPLALAHDQETLALISEVAREQSLRLPKSAGWHLYPQWFEAFQHVPEEQMPPLHGKVGLLMISEGDDELEAQSLRSVSISHGQPHHIAKASAENISQALNELLAHGCDSVVPVTAGDRLGANALARLSALLVEGCAWGYSDCDRDGAKGERSFPWFKPVWDIDLFVGADIFTPGAIFSSGIIDKALSLLIPTEKQHQLNWDQLLAGIVLATETSKADVVHLPYVLYHRSVHSAASPELAQPSPSRQHAIAWLCEKLATGTTVAPVSTYPALLRAHWPLPMALPKVSLIVPTRDQVGLLRTCIEGLLNETDYPDMEIIVVDNQSSDEATLAYFDELVKRGVKVLSHPYPFNYSAINNHAARYAQGELIALVNNDIEIIESSWLKEMVSQVERPGVGAVGAKLMWPNRMVQHAGVVVGINGLAAHTGNTLEQRDPGYLGMNQVTRRQSAVTAACLLMRKTVFDDVGGLDESAFPVAFNDVDLCLRIHQQGWNLVWTPFAQLIHAESASRGKDQIPEKRARALREQQGFMERWSFAGQDDPYYHPALSCDYLSGPYGGLALSPRLPKHQCGRHLSRTSRY
ncbi:glycosyltransferase [Pseudomonas capeferrum]|uniref:glycosyltransferase family 2 protein n=1 Tax=Pseudomonas capeferrum TaxID=1495066 RepID=UPI0015E40FD8|nr:glycosyltransferase family 2 protein [Pseudomonas capeferrum]MBA1204431.1 glycosyltransferase [Pseudomonas capeferrum]